MHATLFQTVYDPYTHQDYMKDDSFTNKTWEGFGGQVKAAELRIWPEQGHGEEIREGEQMSDILIMKKMHCMIQKTISDTDAALLCNGLTRGPNKKPKV